MLDQRGVFEVAERPGMGQGLVQAATGPEVGGSPAMSGAPMRRPLTIIGDNAWTQILFGNEGTAGVARIVVDLIGEGGIDELAFAAVPVPAAVWLFGSALAGLAVVRRRKGEVTA